MMITFQVLQPDGQARTVEVPGDINLSLMELLRAAEYPIEATCGGMALCATCCVEIISGGNKIEEPRSAELDMLDTLPGITPSCRLACQIGVGDQLQGVVLKLRPFKL